MSAVFPSAQVVPTFWANVLAGTDLIAEVPRDRRDAEPVATGESR